MLRIEETFGRQYLAIDARAAADGRGDPGAETGDLDRLAAEIAGFREAQAEKLARWRARLAEWRGQGARVVAWGAGAKAVGFFNMLSSATDRAGGRHQSSQAGPALAGTGQLIVPPRACSTTRPTWWS